MVEGPDGSHWIFEAGNLVRGSYDNRKVRWWSYDAIAALFNLPVAGAEQRVAR